MACLSAIGALVSIAFSSPMNSEAVQTAQVAVLGIVSAILVWVYRYIIKLSYFYDARADALAVLKNNDDDTHRQQLEVGELDDFKRILQLLSPAVDGSITSAAVQLVDSARHKQVTVVPGSTTQDAAALKRSSNRPTRR
jgi:hypothetical protein